ncbi:MAG: hypothetical protein UZ16_OP3001002562 [Candidatus Hinthialibacteria bacterium OLB16]|nr:MAG: hypothetical protein UZ16_OP3001002562 [Candidatus Hinthialibacteria bacterium OLB16]
MLHPSPAFDNTPCAAVSERDRLLEFGAHFLQCSQQPFRPNPIDDFSDLVRALACFGEQTAACQISKGAFSPGRDKRISCFYQDMAGRAGRRGNLPQGQLTGSEILEDLFHPCFL